MKYNAKYSGSFGGLLAYLATSTKSPFFFEYKIASEVSVTEFGFSKTLFEQNPL